MLDIEFREQDRVQLQQLGIAAVILFGSHAQGTAGVHSDIDIGVLLRASITQKTAVYNALYDILSSRMKSLVNIDIVFLEQAPLDLQTHVMKHGKVLFESTPGIFANYRERVMETSADFEPYRLLFHSAILSRIQP